ncbi:transcriptional regulator [Streptomyces profundus]|uniref:transcriptional regulator n=1 Tax=Streptomyces profundus TaxID=2867410 RepID=UPI001D160234|nr:transcriptional regulator [Streptomyces sp. MA3_2.13]UED85121.1 transcriptional regulator [Streptomyces sp. MA3_2.13]
MEPNTLLDALLDEAGISHLGLAARVNRLGSLRGLELRYDNTSVIRWLKGQRPRGQVPDVICEILSSVLQRTISLDDIGMTGQHVSSKSQPSLNAFVDRAAALWRADEQRRVESFAVKKGTDAIAPVWEWENPPEDLDVGRKGSLSVDSCDVALLRTARTHYEQMYRKVGGVATRSRIAQFLFSQVMPLLRGTYSDRMGRELHRAVGGLVAVAGICSYDSDAQGYAQRYFHQALRLAKASGDRQFGAYVMVLMVNQAVYLRDYRLAVAFAEAGLRAAGARISPALATDLYAMQAKAFARMGDQSAAHRCMRRSEMTVGRIRPSEEPAETGYVQPGLIEAHFAEALMSLGDTVPAQEYALEAVRTQAHFRGRVHRLATFARTQSAAGEVEGAARTALEMVDAARGMESRRLRERLVSVRNTLSQHEARAARGVVELIDETLLVPFG